MQVSPPTYDGNGLCNDNPVRVHYDQVFGDLGCTWADDA